MNQTLIGVIVGLIVGAVIAFFASRSGQQTLSKSLDEAKGQVSSKDEEIKKLNTQLQETGSKLSEVNVRAEAAQQLLDSKTTEFESRVNEARTQAQNEAKNLIAEKEKSIEDQKELLRNAEEKLKDAFKSLSGDALAVANEQFKKYAEVQFEKSQEQAKGDLKQRQIQIEEMLKPMKTTMETLDRRIIESDKNSNAGQKVIDEQLKILKSSAENLTSVLKKPVMRGSWGETTLKNVLEGAGLVENIDYTLQDSTTDDGKTLRADAVINMPNNSKLVVDSKNLWEDYARAMQAETDEEQKSAFESHAKALRAEIKSLAAKDYAKQYPGLSGVLLFLPFEGMYLSAIDYDREIVQFAHDRHVYLTSPVTLKGVLDSVKFILSQEKLNKNAQEISDIAKKLYEGVCIFAEKYDKVGKQFEQAMGSFNDSVGSFESSVASRARRISELGVDSTKSLESPSKRNEHVRELSRSNMPKDNILPINEDDS